MPYVFIGTFHFLNRMNFSQKSSEICYTPKLATVISDRKLRSFLDRIHPFIKHTTDKKNKYF